MGNTRFYSQLTPAIVFLSALVCSLFGALIIMLVLVVDTNQQTSVNHHTGLVNQTYNRIMTCILSETPGARTNDYIRGCYDEAQKETGTTVIRYGTAK